MNLRLLALTGVAAGAIALPLAVASAGPAGDGERTTVRLPARAPRATSRPETERPDTERPDTERPDADAKGPAAASFPGHARTTGPAGRSRPQRSGQVPVPSLPGRPGAGAAARCGPELTAPEGVEAQTCVLARGEEVWARTYYRNATGRALQAVLSLMGPKGRTVRMRCAVSAGDEPASCDTPRDRDARGGRGEGSEGNGRNDRIEGNGRTDRSDGGGGADGGGWGRSPQDRGEPGSAGPDRYTAVAEFAGTGTDAPLLLRTGSDPR